jgi:O-antigen/teichoic acid export membrane protein
MAANQGVTEESVDVKAEIKKLQQKVGRLTGVCAVLLIALLIFLWVPQRHARTLWQSQDYEQSQDYRRYDILRYMATAILVISFSFIVCNNEGATGRNDNRIEERGGGAETNL